MKKTKKMILATAVAACFTLSALGLAACGGDDNGDKGDKGGNNNVVVINVGTTEIGTVTATGATYDIQGTVDTTYKLTAQVNGEASEDVLITVGEVTNTAFVTFTYTAGSEVNLKAVEDDVEGVKVVLEEYTEPEIPGPDEDEAITLSADNLTATVTDLSEGDRITVRVNTAADKTYTLTVGDGLGIMGREGTVFTVNFDGKDYDIEDFDNVATFVVTAMEDVESATITLEIRDPEDGDGNEDGEYDALQLGDNEITGASMFEGVIYTLEITQSGYYSFAGLDPYDVVVGTGLEEDYYGGLGIAEDGFQEPIYESDDEEELEQQYYLEAGTYYVAVYNNGTLTIKAINEYEVKGDIGGGNEDGDGEGEGEGDGDEDAVVIPEAYYGEYMSSDYRYMFDIGEDGVDNFMIGMGNYDYDATIVSYDEEKGIAISSNGVIYYVKLVGDEEATLTTEDGSVNVTLDFYA